MYNLINYHAIDSLTRQHGMNNENRQLKGHNTQRSAHMGQNQLMVEIYSMSVVRAIGKVLRMKFS